MSIKLQNFVAGSTTAGIFGGILGLVAPDKIPQLAAIGYKIPVYGQLMPLQQNILTGIVGSTSNKGKKVSAAAKKIQSGKKVTKKKAVKRKAAKKKR